MKLGIRQSIDRIRTFSRVFVERPRFAMVIATVLAVSGLMAAFRLPIAQYPQVTPPTVRAAYDYPGANAREVLRTVATPIEEAANGVEGMMYMVGRCMDDGSYRLVVSFDVDTDRDIDMVKLQNRVTQAEVKLPQEVRQLGGKVSLEQEDILAYVMFRSPSGAMSRQEISDYVNGTIQPVLLRVRGIGSLSVYGSQMAMRVWLDPARLAAQGLDTEDVIAAVSRQNVQASLGSVGAAPTAESVGKTYTLVGKGRLMTPQEFDEIVIRRDANGGLVRLRDVARTEFGEDKYAFVGDYDGRPAIIVALTQRPGTNATEAMDDVRRALAELAYDFPSGLEWRIPYDATEFVRICIREIVETLILTFLLVVIVCYLFLQDWRATLIPCLTIPVSLAATLVVLSVLGYSINLLTLFGLVLSIGVVVDDCIVVVERVQHLIETEGLNAQEATIRAMSDVTGAVIATTLVLLGIFVPIGLMGGITGRIYQQFSVALSAAVCFSTVCALTLAPALASLLLRPHPAFAHGPFAWFNRTLDGFKGFFVGCARGLAVRPFLTAVLLGLSAVLAVRELKSAKTSFLPTEDQGLVYVALELPEGSVRDRTHRVLLRGEELVRALPEVQGVISVAGYSIIGGRAENLGLMIVKLRDWDARSGAGQDAVSLSGRFKRILAAVPEGKWSAFTPPAIPGLGETSGISFHVQNKVDMDPFKVDAAIQTLIARLQEDPRVLSAFTGFTAKTPHLRFDLDRTKAEMHNVPVASVYATLQNYLGSRYVNDVNLGTQVNRVIVQSGIEGRATPEDVPRLYVRSETGDMVPIESLGTVVRELGPRSAYTRDKYVTAAVTVIPRPGVASGILMKEIRQLARETLPQGMDIAWHALSYQEAKNEGSTAPLVLLAVLFGYLFLVAQYESWTIPVPVMLSVFVAMLGALLGLRWWGVFMTGSPYALSIYAQLGLVLLVGLASKNAILIVEFAMEKHEREGLGIVAAAGVAAGERLRPLLMTALTTLLGTLPMMIATGAGARSRNHLGTTEFWGMAASVAFGILLVPGLYALFQTLREKIKGTAKMI